ncbi:MAG: hypothetical protein EKK48_31055 [Candidatus Melainabacteria bacterium]|nr:MAG: hypothetical protein EKK48_31055 [Candidatus Melainabacteria bacterium]
MSSYNGAIGNPAWFAPMQLLLDAVGPDDPRYIFWNGALGNSLGAFLCDMEQVCEASPFAYPDMTQENISALGLKEIFRLWMFEYFQSLYRIE